MRRSWKYFLFLLWLSYLFVCGILLFTRGFLLSRRTLLQKSSCIENLDCSPLQKLSKEDPCLENTQLYLECLDRNQLKLRDNSREQCLKSDRKVVLLIIDALRYDFAFYNHTLEPQQLLPFQNRLGILDELLTTLPNNSLLLKFIANPPTTTMQRLKGLTTGSLPTFIDIGSNFATPEINEDNILDQLLDQKKKVVFMGDDTWTALYPGRFKRQYPYPSFNVWDLDTVDNGIITHLKPELLKKDWSLLIAHFLGVDHCGHKYGPFHPEMSRKLNQMNDVIRSVVDTMDENTMLFVIGDHGMTPTGDHGGESSDEITSALFVYSPVPFLSGNIVVKTDSVYQVDIVPTLAAILGFAIPFSNLGKVILPALPQSRQNSNVNDINSDIQQALNILSINVEQIMLYINTYSRQIHAFSKGKVSSLLDRFHSLKWKLTTVNDNTSFKFYHKTAIEFLNYVRELCEEVWVQFDSFSMSRGLVLTFLLLAFTFFIIEGIPCSRLNSLLDGLFLWIAYSTVVVCVAVSIMLQTYKIVDDMYLLIYVSTLSISMLIMAIVVVQNWDEITMLWFNTYRNRDWSNVLTRFIHLCSLLLMFSNSFVIEEGSVLSFMLNTAVWLVVYNINFQESELSTKSKGNEKGSWLTKILSQTKVRSLLLAVIFTFLLRGSQYYWRCREEQKWCIIATDATKATTSFKSGRGNLDAITPLAVLALFVSATRIWLRSCGNLVGFSPTVILVRYAPSVVVVCLGGFWVLQGLPQEARSKLFVPWQLQILPCTAFFLIGLTIFSLYVQPLCVYVMEKKSDVVSVYGNENIIPQLFHQVKKVIKNSDENESLRSKSPLVYGLATAYSAVFIILAEFISLFVISLLGDVLASSVIVMFAAMVVVLTILAYARLDSSIVTNQIFHVPWTYVLIWGLLASYFFYGTGHQPTFPGIHWYAAFVGTGGQFSSNIIPGFLVGANTFGSYIIAGLILPALLIAPFTLPVMLPSWCSTTGHASDKIMKKHAANEIREGDICLYERDGLSQYALLKLSSKYILYHGTRIFTCMLAAAVHCRHLMVWMIFTPRFIFEGVSFMVSLVSVLLGNLLFIRVSIKVDELMNDIYKKLDL
ncbi:hypothetical protein RUM44_005717 [Polyplax serrata]|uniref:GPI ethanolamine phosphate transferase 3 n=1 Tax=Polyplax serrata TaxID=468196 RepID=A0ABR1AWB6_POLSC